MDFNTENLLAQTIEAKRRLQADHVHLHLCIRAGEFRGEPSNGIEWNAYSKELGHGPSCKSAEEAITALVAKQTPGILAQKAAELRAEAERLLAIANATEAQLA